MLLKEFSAISLLLIFAIKPALPAKACSENCHSGSGNCHRTIVSQSETPKCPHAKPVSKVEMAVKAGCECTIQENPSTVRDTQFTLDPLRSERSKASGTDVEFSSKAIPVLFETRLNGPPFSLTPDRQDTFLVNSTLRI